MHTFACTSTHALKIYMNIHAHGNKHVCIVYIYIRNNICIKYIYIHTYIHPYTKNNHIRKTSQLPNAPQIHKYIISTYTCIHI